MRCSLDPPPGRPRGRRLAWAAVGLFALLDCAEGTTIDPLECPLPTEDVRVVAIESGHGIHLALMSDGSLYCWGSNDLVGACADVDGYSGRYVYPVRSEGVRCLDQLYYEGTSAVGVSPHGDVLVWGHTWPGIEDHDSGVSSLESPARVRSATGRGSVYLNTDEGLYWQGGIKVMGSTPPEPDVVVEAAELTRIALPEVVDVASDGHACAIVENGELYCWGYSSDGQLGYGIGVGASLPMRVPAPGPLVAVAAGYNATCALDPTGAVYCAGGNQFGLIGPGYPEQVGELTRIDGLPPLEQLWMYSFDACGTSDGELWCWGIEGGPQSMGISDVVDLGINDVSMCVLQSSGHVYCNAFYFDDENRGNCKHAQLGWTKVEFESCL